nr:hypothetical protein [Lachnospiraceae bacterium]
MFEDAAGKKLLIIGGEASIVNIVTQAREMGVYTIVTERGTDRQKLPAKAAADEAWDIDYSDMETLVRKCREEKVDGVFSGYSEGKVYYAAQLSRLLGTPFYVTPEQVQLTRNKRSFKELCVKYGLPVPKEYCLNGRAEDLDRSAVRYPVIVKPADYGGRIGITICHGADQLEDALTAAENSSETRTVVVEEFLTGTELTALYTIVDGEISLSIVNDKCLSLEGDRYSALCDIAVTPSRFYQLYLDTTDQKIKELLRGIGVRNGMAGFQLIAAGDRIVPFEMALRLNGGNDWKLLQICNGINYMKMMIHYSLTGSMGDSLEKDNADLKDCMATYILYAHEGEVGHVDCSALQDCPYILDINPYVYEGKHILDKGTTQQRCFSFKIRAGSLKEVADIIHLIQDSVHVDDVNGRSLLFKNFDTDRLYG